MKLQEYKKGLVYISYALALGLVLFYLPQILAGGKWLVSLFGTFGLGVGIAFVLNLPCSFFYRHLSRRCKPGVANLLSVLGVYLALAAVLALAVGLLIPQLSLSLQTFLGNLDRYALATQGSLDAYAQALGLTALNITDLVNYIETYFSDLSQAAGSMMSQILSTTGTVLSSVVDLFVGLAFSVYLLAGRETLVRQLRRAARALIPQRAAKNVAYLCSTVVSALQNYILGQTTEAVILGSLCCLGMLVLRLDYAGLVSVIVAITAMIPILGAYLGGGVAVFLLLLVSPQKALVFLVFFLILQQVENNLIYPRVVGGRIGLPGIWVLLGITVGGRIGGILGMLLGVPAMTILYTLFRDLVLWQERRKAAAPQPSKNDL